MYIIFLSSLFRNILGGGDNRIRTSAQQQPKEPLFCFYSQADTPHVVAIRLIVVVRVAMRQVDVPRVTGIRRVASRGPVVAISAQRKQKAH